MNSTSLRRAALPGVAALTLGMALSACGASNENTGSGSSSSSSSSTELSGDLSGAGSSAQQKAQEAWSTGFQGAHSGVTVNYDPVGSGDGRKQFIAKGVSFAGSDSYLSDDEGELTAAKKRCGGDPIEVPAYVSPIAVIYNLKGVKDLQLSPKTVAGIFDNKITKWNDPAIKADNPSASLPGTSITPVHRSDDSGTTKNFTDYLSKASGGAWTYKAADAFPTKGEAAEGTSGVVTAVTGGDGTIGYADESQAGSLGKAKIKVGSAYTAPSADGAAKVVKISTGVAGRPAVDMAVDLDRTTTESGSYQVLLVSYLIACQKYSVASEGALVNNYLEYAVSTDGHAAA
ncbi:MAG: phosphate transporter substrate-binding protein, partial [Marmoricola sp.]|nr:phosphate transporter substrate-binding protein [Marmoricola sp.]